MILTLSLFFSSLFFDVQDDIDSSEQVSSSLGGGAGQVVFAQSSCTEWARGQTLPLTTAIRRNSALFFIALAHLLHYQKWAGESTQPTGRRFQGNTVESA